MSDIFEKLVVLTVTRDETRVWATGIARGAIPVKVYAPPARNSHHFRDDPKHHGRGDGPGVPRYYEEIIAAIRGASQILLIGHGHGKASSMMHFVQYLERKHPDIAALVADALDTNLIAMTEPEILAMARSWCEEHQFLWIDHAHSS
jgi:arginine repressor